MLVCVFNSAGRAENFTTGISEVEAIIEEVWNTELEEWEVFGKEHNESGSSQRRWKDYPQTLTFHTASSGNSIGRLSVVLSNC